MKKLYLMVFRKVIFSCRMGKIMSQVRVSKAIISGYVVRMPLFEETGLAVFSWLTAAKHGDIDLATLHMAKKFFKKLRDLLNNTNRTHFPRFKCIYHNAHKIQVGLFRLLSVDLIHLAFDIRSEFVISIQQKSPLPQ